MSRRRFYVIAASALFAAGFVSGTLWGQRTGTASLLAARTPTRSVSHPAGWRTPVEALAVTEQLRIYTINRGKLDDFVTAWRDGVYQLRLEQGYEIPSAWKIEETNQFVWVVRYDGPESWGEKEAAYYSSAQRRSLDPDPKQWIARPEQRFVTRVVP